jgi:hypothetical protein
LWQQKAWNDNYPDYKERILKKGKEKYVKKLMPQRDLHLEYHRASYVKKVQVLHDILDGKTDLKSIEHMKKKKRL